jgi:hypothetical protein
MKDVDNIRACGWGEKGRRGGVGEDRRTDVAYGATRNKATMKSSRKAPG